MEATSDPVLACGVVTCFGRQWELQEFTDFTVHIAGKNFKCHRIILEACSKFFNGSQDNCSLKDIEPEIFELILEAMYKGRNILNVDNAINMWAAAWKLEIDFLCQVCEEFVMGMITVDNYMSIHRMATSLNSWKVLHAVRQKIVQEFNLVMLSDTFLELTLDDILAVIGCQDIKVCADGLVQAIFTWVKAEAFDGSDREMRADGATCPANTMDMNRLETDKSRSIASDRANYLGIMLEAVNLEDISDDCLTQLMSDDMVLTCYKAVHAVNMIAVQRLNIRGEPHLDTCASSGTCLLHQANQQLLENLGPSLQTSSERKTEVTSTVDPVLACGVMHCLEQFQDLQTFSDISDFTVQVGEKSFKCHKFIIGSCSEFFSGLLRSNMKEKAENSAEIKGIRSCIFELILEVLYRGRNILTTDNMIEVWHAANQLQIVFLIQTCEKFIIPNITIERCVDIYKHATLLWTGDVLKETRQFIVRHVYQIMMSDSFRDLSVDDLLDIFASSNMNLCSNGLVQCILKWLDAKTYAARDMGVENETTSSGNSSSSNTFHNLIPDVSDKHEDLEKLMKVVKLDSASDDCLKKLMCNEMVLATPNVIRAVNTIVVKRWNSRSSLRYYKASFRSCSRPKLKDCCSFHEDRDYHRTLHS